MNILKIAWARWVALARVIATYQSYLLLGIFYYLILWPAGLIIAIFADPLGIKRKKHRTNFVPWTHEQDTIADLSRQY
jgi:hypothetical protein